MAIGEGFDGVLQAARLGEEWAWAAIYRDLSPAVLRYLRARKAPDPEDLLGSVFVAVVRGIHGFTGGERDLRAWAFTIARNRLTDEWRRSRMRVAPVPDDELEVLLEAGAPAGDQQDHDHISFVLSVLESLSPDQRDVLFLRVVAGLTVAETAAVVGKRPGAVKALQLRALGAIRRQLLAEAVSI